MVQAESCYDGHLQPLLVHQSAGAHNEPEDPWLRVVVLDIVNPFPRAAPTNLQGTGLAASGRGQHAHLDKYISTFEGLVRTARPRPKGLVLITPCFLEPNGEDPMRAMMDQCGQTVRD
jgi:hypothetical protein